MRASAYFLTTCAFLGLAQCSSSTFGSATAKPPDGIEKSPVTVTTQIEVTVQRSADRADVSMRVQAIGVTEADALKGARNRPSKVEEALGAVTAVNNRSSGDPLTWKASTVQIDHDRRYWSSYYDNDLYDPRLWSSDIDEDANRTIAASARICAHFDDIGELKDLAKSVKTLDGVSTRVKWSLSEASMGSVRTEQRRIAMRELEEIGEDYMALLGYGRAFPVEVDDRIGCGRRCYSLPDSESGLSDLLEDGWQSPTMEAERSMTCKIGLE